MTYLFRCLAMTFALLIVAAPALADEAAADADPAAAAAEADTNTTPPVVAPAGFSMDLGKAVGAGLVIIGAALGIGRIGGQAVEGMSRQPEAAGSIQTGMIIAAALIEGATFFALIVVLIA